MSALTLTSQSYASPGANPWIYINVYKNFINKRRFSSACVMNALTKGQRDTKSCAKRPPLVREPRLLPARTTRRKQRANELCSPAVYRFSAEPRILAWADRGRTVWGRRARRYPPRGASVREKWHGRRFLEHDCPPSCWRFATPGPAASASQERRSSIRTTRGQRTTRVRDLTRPSLTYLSSTPVSSWTTSVGGGAGSLHAVLPLSSCHLYEEKRCIARLSVDCTHRGPWNSKRNRVKRKRTQRGRREKKPRAIGNFDERELRQIIETEWGRVWFMAVLARTRVIYIGSPRVPRSRLEPRSLSWND